jgi:transaldolase
MFNQDAMAVEKLAEGLRLFDEDAQRLEEFRRPKAA